MFDAVEKASFASLFDPSGRNPGEWYSASFLFSDARGIWRDPRFVRLTGKIGLNAYWSSIDQWPDIADELFRNRIRAAAAP